VFAYKTGLVSNPMSIAAAVLVFFPQKGGSTKSGVPNLLEEKMHFEPYYTNPRIISIKRGSHIEGLKNAVLRT
jgi:hypothetical protein